MNRFFLLFILGGWFCSFIYAQNDQDFFSLVKDKKQVSRILAKDGISHYNILQDINGDIVFLELCGTKETEYFLDNYKDTKGNFKLRTMIVRDFASKHYFDKLLDFIKSQGATLQNLYFKRHDGKAMPQEFLKILIPEIMNFSLNEFKWENQDAIDNPAMVSDLSNYTSFWQKLKILSFNKTKIREKAFFLHRIRFDSLQSLELAETTLKYHLLDSLIFHAENFPSLCFLNLNDLDFNEKSFITSEKAFSSLKTVTIYKERSYSKNFSLFFTKNNNWIKNAENIVINLRRNVYQKPYKDIHMTTDGSFIYDYGKPLAMNNLGDDGLFFAWFPNLKFSGSFQRPQKGGPDRRLDSMGLRLVLVNQQDIDMFNQYYPLDQAENIIFMSPDILKYQIDYFIENITKYPRLKSINLIHTGITVSDLENLQLMAHSKNIQMNVINTSANAPKISYRASDMFFQQIFMQQMMKTPTIKF